MIFWISSSSCANILVFRMLYFFGSADSIPVKMRRMAVAIAGFLGAAGGFLKSSLVCLFGWRLIVFIESKWIKKNHRDMKKYFGLRQGVAWNTKQHWKKRLADKGGVLGGWNPRWWLCGAWGGEKLGTREEKAFESDLEGLGCLEPGACC